MTPYTNSSHVFKIAPAFYLGFTRERRKRFLSHFKWLRGQYIVRELRVEQACSRPKLWQYLQIGYGYFLSKQRKPQLYRAESLKSRKVLTYSLLIITFPYHSTLYSRQLQDHCYII